MEKNTTTIDILHNRSNYPTVCLLLDTAHRTDHCITVCGKWIFDSNLESELPLTKASLSYICSGNDTDEITFVGVLHVLYHPWHRHCIIWDMKLRQNISSGASNCLLLSFMVKVECNSAVILLWDNTEGKKNKKYIIIFKNEIHARRHMIYCRIIIIIQLCVCY